MSTSTETVFGYGSNLSWDLLRNRLNDGDWAEDDWYKTGNPVGPDPIDLGIGILWDYRFKYNLWENPFLESEQMAIQTSGNIVNEYGDRVYGAVYQITPQQLALLDKDEDEGKAYMRTALKVHTLSGQVLNTWCYVGNSEYIVCDEQIAPEQEYVDKVVQYATERKLPQGYIDNRLRYLAPVLA